MDEMPKFTYGSKQKFSLKEQKQIGEYVKTRKRKHEEDLKDPTKNKSVWNAKRKRWTKPLSQVGFIQPTVRELFTNLKDATSDNKEFKSATKYVSRCLEKYEQGKFDVAGNNVTNKYRLLGAGAPRRAREVREALFDYFVDIRCSLKGRLPLFMLRAKAHELYEEYCKLKVEAGETPESLKMSNAWLTEWCKEYRVSLKQPNKRFSIPQETRKRRIIQFLQNVWRARYFWKVNYKREPNILSADQMPLHRNESSAQKSLNFKGRNASTFVKENTSLSRERCTVMTIATSSSNKSSAPPVEFVFKGNGVRIAKTLKPPGKIKFQFAEKGSYRLAHVTKFIEGLPKIHTNFTPRNRDIFTLDDYSAHLPPVVENKVDKQGYFLLVMGGGITGDLQVNDTHYHRPTKQHYRNNETKLMIEKLKENPGKIPAPNRNEMMNLFADAWATTNEEVNNVDAYKRNMITIALDGSEDALASRNLMNLVGEEMLQFRKELLASAPPTSLKQLRAQIIKPEGVKYPTDDNEAPTDEGQELLDGDYIEIEEDELEDSGDDETSAKTDEIEETDGPSQSNPTSSSQHFINDDLVLFDEIGTVIDSVRKRSSNRIMPQVVEIENVFKNLRRKILKSKSTDGILLSAMAGVATGNYDEIQLPPPPQQDSNSSPPRLNDDGLPPPPPPLPGSDHSDDEFPAPPPGLSLYNSSSDEEHPEFPEIKPLSDLSGSDNDSNDAERNIFEANFF